MFGEKCHALMRGRDVYSLQPIPQSLRAEYRPFRYWAYKNGQLWRRIVHKRDFDLAVACEPLPAPLGPHAEAAFRAEMFSTCQGNQILDRLEEAYEKRMAKVGA
jgi:hypothetical protein